MTLITIKNIYNLAMKFKVLYFLLKFYTLTELFIFQFGISFSKSFG